MRLQQDNAHQVQHKCFFFAVPLDTDASGIHRHSVAANAGSVARVHFVIKIDFFLHDSVFTKCPIKI